MIQQHSDTTPLMQSSFDYGDMDEGTASQYQEIATTVQGMARMVGATVVEIGRRITWAYEHRPNWSWWNRWIRNEVGWTEKQADEYMRAYKLFGDVDWTSANAEPRALFDLSRYLGDDPRISLAHGALRRGEYLGIGKVREIEEAVLPEDVRVYRRQQDEHRRELARLKSTRDAATTRRRKKEAQEALREAKAHTPVAPPRVVAPTISPRDMVLITTIKNLQIALAECYGVPLRSPVAAALSRLQLITSAERIDINHAAVALRDYFNPSEIAALKELL
jgi:hypothetical protein